MSKRLLPDMETLKKHYAEEKLSCKDICRKYNLSPNSSGNLSRMLKKDGVEIRKDAGENHHNWKGGRILKGDGYIGIWNPSHERADSQGYVYEHTLVYEEKTDSLPNKNEVIHHVDIDKLNNDFENLYLCDNKSHLVCHRSIESLIKPLMEKGIVGFKDGIYYIK